MAEELLLERYKLIETAGKGGYGTVHRAYDTRLQREVAIKCIQLSPEDAERSRLAEARAKSGGAQQDGSGSTGNRKRRPLDNTAEEAPPRRRVKPLVEFDRPEIDNSFPGDPGFLNARDDRDAARRDAGYGYDGYDDYDRGYGDYDDGYGYDDYGDGYDYDFSAYGTSRYSTRLEQNRHGDGAHNPATMAISRAISSAKDLVGRGDDEAESSIAEEEDPLAHIPGLEEARTAAHLSDTNIVTVYDCEVHDGYAYIIMEYIEGKTLTEVLHELGDNITLDMVGAVFNSVTHALKAAHKKKVLHLDIKPDNVIIDKDGVVKVTDFGLATLADSAGHATTGGGTIGYMPLEQMRLEPLDVRTDEWALASLTYEMLVGVNPFFAPDLATAEKVIEGAELILPSSRWDDLTPEIDDPIFAALSPDPDGRYDTVNAFAVVVKPQLGSAKKGKKELAEVVAGSASGVSESIALSSSLIDPASGNAVGGVGAAGAEPEPVRRQAVSEPRGRQVPSAQPVPRVRSEVPPQTQESPQRPAQRVRGPPRTAVPGTRSCPGAAGAVRAVRAHPTPKAPRCLSVSGGAVAKARPSRPIARKAIAASKTPSPPTSPW